MTFHYHCTGGKESHTWWLTFYSWVLYVWGSKSLNRYTDLFCCITNQKIRNTHLNFSSFSFSSLLFCSDLLRLVLGQFFICNFSVVYFLEGHLQQLIKFLPDSFITNENICSFSMTSVCPFCNHEIHCECNIHSSKISGFPDPYTSSFLVGWELHHIYPCVIGP